MNKTFKKLTYTTMLGATLLGLGSVEAFANDETHRTEGSAIKTTTSDQTIVYIPDEVLLEQIRYELNKPTGDITQADMERLDYLTLEGNIKSLEGLEYALNLQMLILTETLISDLSPISGLTELISLGLVNVPISDLSSLQNLKNLQELTLSGNYDLSSLENLTNIKYLSLAGDNFTDLNQITHLTWLEGLGLMQVPIKELSQIKEFPKLSSLILYGTSISDLTPLTQLYNLKELGLVYSEIYDFTVLDNLNLKTLMLGPQSTSRNIKVQNNTLENPFQLADGTYLKFHNLSDGVTQSEDGSTFYFENPQQGETYTIETETCVFIETDLVPQNTKNSIINHSTNKKESKIQIDCSLIGGSVPDQNKSIQGDYVTFTANLTIDSLMGEVNPIWTVGEQVINQKTTTVDFTDSFYPVEKLILPDGTEIQGNQATFVINKSNDYTIKAYDSQGNEYIETKFIEIETPLEINGENISIEVGEKIDLITLITIEDKDGNLIPVIKEHILSHNVNTDKPGVYEVHYQITDKYGQITEKTLTITVVGKETEEPIIPDEENKPSTPEEDNPVDTEKPSVPDQPSVESDKDEVIPSNPSEDNENSSNSNNNQDSSNQTETHKPTERPTVEAGLSSIGLIGLGLVSLISGAFYLKRKKK